MLMKTFLLVHFLLCTFISIAQVAPDSLKTSNSSSFIADTDTTDKRARNAYGDLLHDDPLYNPKQSVGLGLARVTSSNVFGWAYSR